ncbi:MAG: amidohydrolase [Wenzhouxiangella sp.]|nr:amidohydrolase [Wenzhouxiangella sp.]
MIRFTCLPITLLLAALSLTACTEPESEPAPPPEPERAPEPAMAADLIFYGGPIITMDPDNPEAEAVAVRHGRIFAVGNRAQIDGLIGSGTEQIDLDGRTLLPGFIEGHGHFLGLGQAKMILDLTDTTSFDEIVAKVAAAVEDAEPGSWISGRGWHQERWQAGEAERFDGVPAHAALSEVSPDNPVVLIHASGHASFANARALAAAGIDADTPDPVGGTIVRDSDGKPTGFLRQAAQTPVRQAMARAEEDMDEDERQALFERQVALAGEEALRHGITSFHDQGASFAEIDRLRAIAAAGELPVRLHVAVRGETNADMNRRLQDYRLVGHANHFLTVRAIKRQIDGALGTHGAWLLRPYADKPDTSGLPQTPPNELAETARIAVAHGFQLNTHAIGDRGNREALDVYENVLTQQLDDDLRWRIEHAQNLHPDEVPRFAKLGVIASMQGIHATSDGPWVPQRLGEERARRKAYVWRSLLDAGATICNGTDAPVEPLSPIASLAASITRLMANDEQFFPEQAMTREEALRSYTIDCARAVFEEELLGSISAGKLADLVVLSDNPLTVSEDELPNLEVELTLLDGQIRYRREP